MLLINAANKATHEYYPDTIFKHFGLNDTLFNMVKTFSVMIYNADISLTLEANIRLSMGQPRSRSGPLRIKRDFANHNTPNKCSQRSFGAVDLMILIGFSGMAPYVASSVFHCIRTNRGMLLLNNVILCDLVNWVYNALLSSRVSLAGFDPVP